MNPGASWLPHSAELRSGRVVIYIYRGNFGGVMEGGAKAVNVWGFMKGEGFLASNVQCSRVHTDERSL